MKTQKTWPVDKLMSIAAIILSLGTLLVFIYQTSLIRKHQYASVMPYIEIGTQGVGSPNMSFYIENNGVGPAIITDVNIFYKGKKYQQSPIHFLRNTFPKAFDSTAGKIKYSAINPGMLISAKQQILVLEASNSMEASETINTILGNGDIQLEITYQSIFEETWKINQAELSPYRINK